MSRPFHSQARIPSLGTCLWLDRTAWARLPAGLFVTCIAVVLVFTPGALGQTKKNTPSPSFARYVPESANCFVSVPHLDQWDETLPQLGLSAAVVASGDTGTSVRWAGGDWRKALMHTIGDESAIDLSTLLTVPAGVAADTCDDLSHAVWFFRLPDPGVLDTWFPSASRKVPGQSERAMMFRTPDGLIVALRDDVLLLARRWVGDGLLVSVMQLMTGKSLPSLDQSKAYRELVAYLPSHAMGTIFLVSPKAGSGVRPSTLLRPVFGSMIFALYDAGDRIDVAIRGKLRDEFARVPVKADVVDQLLRLPSSTILASVSTATIDLNRVGVSDNPRLSRYAKLLLTLRGARADANKSLPVLGPHVVLAWGQDLTSPSDFPQVTLLAECVDADQMATETDNLLTSVLDAVRTLRADFPATALEIKHETHLGVAISYVPPLAPELADRLGVFGLLTDVELAWAAWGDWIAVSTHRSHLKQILDAQFGLSPTLGSLPGAGAVSPRGRRAAAVAIMRGNAAAQQVGAWLANRSAPKPLWLDPLWWGSVLSGDLGKGTALGLGFGRSALAGQLAVTSVEPGTLSDGLVLTNDQILGVNGRLLALVGAQQDFLRLWQQRNRTHAPVLRVLRGGMALDVELPLAGAGESEMHPFDPSAALRMIRDAGRGAGFGSYVVRPSETRDYAAMLSLQKPKRR